MMKIEIQEEMAKIYTPYDSDFVKKIKLIGGAKWDSSEKCWSVPENTVSTVRKIMEEVYGYSDISENETISLKLIFTDDIYVTCGDVKFFGKIISHAYSRDSGARVGEDVSFESGEIKSGGSVKNWQSIVCKGSVAILSNVNKHLYEKENIPDGIKVEIIEEEYDKNSLLQEKERLLKRISEIDMILKKN